MNELKADETIHNTMNKWTPSKGNKLTPLYRGILLLARLLPDK